MERVGAEAFEDDRLRRPGTWIVGFLADWCPFCRAFAPHLESLGAPPGRGVLLADVTDESSPLWERFGVDVVPTVIVFRDGRPIFRRDGHLGRGLGESDIRAIDEAAKTT
jgi:thioredoxin 1